MSQDKKHKTEEPFSGEDHEKNIKKEKPREEPIPTQGQGQIDDEWSQNVQDEFLDNKLDSHKVQDFPNTDPKQESKKLEENWVLYKDKFLEKHPEVLKTDVRYDEGEFDLLFSRLVDLTGKSRAELKDEIMNWDSKNEN